MLLPGTASAWRILYAEQYYKLYSLPLHQYPDNTMENISYLELALKADFCNPLYALARIDNPREWERYRDAQTAATVAPPVTPRRSGLARGLAKVGSATPRSLTNRICVGTLRVATITGPV